MKRIEDIEKMSLEELELESSQVPVPEGLTGRIKDALAAERVSEPSGAFLAEPFFGEDRNDDRRRRRHWHAAFGSFAVAAAVAAVLILHRPAPKDSFDDPLLAYQQVEETLQFIAQKINKVYE
jgi:negative regulator of sigma E activity